MEADLKSKLHTACYLHSFGRDSQFYWLIVEHLLHDWQSDKSRVAASGDFAFDS